MNYRQWYGILSGGGDGYLEKLFLRKYLIEKH